MAVRVTTHGKLDLQFGPHKLRDEQVFYYGSRSLGIVNMMESCPGHLLVLPKRPVESLQALSDDEAADFMLAIQRTVRVVEDRYGEKHSADGSVVVLVERSSSVPHLHAHIAPRLTDDVLAAIERTETILAGPPERQVGPPATNSIKPTTQKAPISEVQREADILVKIADRAALRQDSPTKQQKWPRPLPSQSNQHQDGSARGACLEFGARMLLTEHCVDQNSSAISFVNPTPTVRPCTVLLDSRCRQHCCLRAAAAGASSLTCDASKSRRAPVEGSEQNRVRRSRHGAPEGGLADGRRTPECRWCCCVAGR